MQCEHKEGSVIRRFNEAELAERNTVLEGALPVCLNVLLDTFGWVPFNIVSHNDLEAAVGF